MVQSIRVGQVEFNSIWTGSVWPSINSIIRAWTYSELSGSQWCCSRRVRDSANPEPRLGDMSQAVQQCGSAAVVRPAFLHDARKTAFASSSLKARAELFGTQVTPVSGSKAEPYFEASTYTTVATVQSPSTNKYNMFKNTQ